MGLDFEMLIPERDDYESGLRPSWSYSGFHAFRKRVAAAIGVDLDSMDHFGGSTSWASVEDALVPLLNHSDCDGELGPDACAQVAPALRAIVKTWPADDYDRTMAERLAAYMERVAETRGRLVFT